jgi:hypothetical protein
MSFVFQQLCDCVGLITTESRGHAIRSSLHILAGKASRVEIANKPIWRIIGKKRRQIALESYPIALNCRLRPSFPLFRSLYFVQVMIETPNLAVFSVVFVLPSVSGNSEISRDEWRHRPVQKTSGYSVMSQDHQRNDVIMQSGLLTIIREKASRGSEEVDAATLKRKFFGSGEVFTLAVYRGTQVSVELRLPAT